MADSEHAGLVERLRAEGGLPPYYTPPASALKAADAIEALEARAVKAEAVIVEISAALCNYLNGCADDFQPVSLWDAESWNNVKRLSDAYNVWHKNNPIIASIASDTYQRLRDAEHADVEDIETRAVKAEQKLDEARALLREAKERCGDLVAGMSARSDGDDDAARMWERKYSGWHVRIDAHLSGETEAAVQKGRNLGYRDGTAVIDEATDMTPERWNTVQGMLTMRQNKPSGGDR